MKAIWKQIDPEGRETKPEKWFEELREAFGPEVPLTVLRHFAQSGQTLSHLRRPQSYRRYFTACCRNAPNSASVPSPASASSPTSPSTPASSENQDPYANYGERLRAAYLARRESRQAAYRKDLSALYLARQEKKLRARAQRARQQTRPPFTLS